MFIDRVLVVCAAWLEVFVEGVSGYMHCVVRRRGSSDTHCVVFCIMEYIFNLSFVANYIKIVLKFKSHSFDENRKGDVRIRCIVFDGRL